MHAKMLQMKKINLIPYLKSQVLGTHNIPFLIIFMISIIDEQMIYNAMLDLFFSYSQLLILNKTIFYIMLYPLRPARIGTSTNL